MLCICIFSNILQQAGYISLARILVGTPTDIFRHFDSRGLFFLAWQN